MKASKHSGRDSSYRAAQLNDTSGPVLQKQDAIIELDQTDAIVTRQVRSKPDGRSSEIFYVVGNGGRSVNHQHHVNRDLTQAQVTQGLWSSVFEDAKVIPLQPFNELTIRVTHRDWEQHLGGVYRNDVVRIDFIVCLRGRSGTRRRFDFLRVSHRETTRTNQEENYQDCRTKDTGRVINEVDQHRPYLSKSCGAIGL